MNRLPFCSSIKIALSCATVVTNVLEGIFPRIAAKVRLRIWTSKANYDEAMAIFVHEQRVGADKSGNAIKRVATERIFARFGNELRTIAVAPKSIREYFTDIDGPEVKCGMGYFIDHMITHHSEVARKEFNGIQEVLDFPYGGRPQATEVLKCLAEAVVPRSVTSAGPSHLGPNENSFPANARQKPFCSSRH